MNLCRKTFLYTQAQDQAGATIFNEDSAIDFLAESLGVGKVCVNAGTAVTQEADSDRPELEATEAKLIWKDRELLLDATLEALPPSSPKQLQQIRAHLSDLADKLWPDSFPDPKQCVPQEGPLADLSSG